MLGISNPIAEADADYREFMEIARTFFAFTVALMRAEINEGRMFSEFPPTACSPSPVAMANLFRRHCLGAKVSSTPW